MLSSQSCNVTNYGLPWSNILSQICSRGTMHNAPRVCSKYAPGAVWIQIMVQKRMALEHAFIPIMVFIMTFPDTLTYKALQFYEENELTQQCFVQL